MFVIDFYLYIIFLIFVQVTFNFIFIFLNCTLPVLRVKQKYRNTGIKFFIGIAFPRSILQQNRPMSFYSFLINAFLFLCPGLTLSTVNFINITRINLSIFIYHFPCRFLSPPSSGFE